MLTREELIPYLLDHQLLSTRCVVDGDLIVIDSSRRNRNFKVISEREPSYLVKQGVGPEGAATVANEAAAYQLFYRNPECAGLKPFLPRFHGYYADERVLVLELLRGAEDLRQYHLRGSRFSTAIAARLGHALASLHRMSQPVGMLRNGEIRFPSPLPWVLTVHQPNQQIFRDISSANLQVLKIVQKFPEFSTLLDSLRQEWSAETLIHFDIKWDNWLVFSEPNKRAKNLRIVDWELTGFGDPCWDVASIFNDYLSFWLLSIPVTTGDVPPEHFPQLARYPLERMHPAMRAFWASYLSHSELDETTAEARLFRSTKLAGARLLQTAFEQMQMSVQITGTIVIFLQLSLNMLRRPHEALVHLLGIPLERQDCAG
jgi:thiamine kinase-like enzyme